MLIYCHNIHKVDAAAVNTQTEEKEKGDTVELLRRYLLMKRILTNKCVYHVVS